MNLDVQETCPQTCHYFDGAGVTDAVLPLLLGDRQAEPMRLLVGFFKVLILFWVLLWATTVGAWEGVVTKVLDGDSMLVKQKKRTVTVRLYGIDCPEYNQPYASAAKKTVQKMVLGQKVRIQPMDTDQYRRTVALVTFRGQILNVELVRRGLAWVYPRYCKKQPLCRQLRDIEGVARANRVGLWQRSAPVPPWKWRQHRR